MSPEQAEATIRELQDWQAADKMVIGDLMEEAESLRADVERLTRERDDSRDLAQARLNRINKLDAKIAELERDRERLEWLENPERVYFVEIQTEPHGAYAVHQHPPGIRAAIDAAMQTNPEK